MESLRDLIDKQAIRANKSVRKAPFSKRAFALWVKTTEDPNPVHIYKEAAEQIGARNVIDSGAHVHALGLKFARLLHQEMTESEPSLNEYRYLVRSSISLKDFLYPAIKKMNKPQWSFEDCLRDENEMQFTITGNQYHKSGRLSMEVVLARTPNAHAVEIPKKSIVGPIEVEIDISEKDMGRYRRLLRETNTQTIDQGLLAGYIPSSLMKILYGRIDGSIIPINRGMNVSYHAIHLPGKSRIDLYATKKRHPAYGFQIRGEQAGHTTFVAELTAFSEKEIDLSKLIMHPQEPAMIKA